MGMDRRFVRGKRSSEESEQEGSVVEQGSEKDMEGLSDKTKNMGVGPTVKKRGQEEELYSQPALRTTKKLNIDDKEERQEWRKHFRLFLPPKTKGQ